MALTGLAFFGLSTFPGWHEERDARTGSDIDIKPFPSRPMSQAITATLFMASIFLLVSALWQHVGAVSAASNISTMSQERLIVHVGATAVALVWLPLAMVICVLQGMLAMILSIHLLDRLTDE